MFSHTLKKSLAGYSGCLIGEEGDWAAGAGIRGRPFFMYLVRLLFLSHLEPPAIYNVKCMYFKVKTF